MINSSSLKGAIRDHFKTVLGFDMDTRKMQTIFGHADKDNANAGEVKFLQAGLLALPVRSNTQMYFLATTPQILKNYMENHLILTKKEINLEIPDIGDGVYISTDDEGCFVEDYEADNSKREALKIISKVFFNSQPIALMNHQTFKTISLPIITRNKIAKKEGEDNNLFYEEVIPRHTIFYSYIITPNESDIDDEKVEKIFESFIEDVNKENIQIGANASIGYGLCQFKEV